MAVDLSRKSQRVLGLQYAIRAGMVVFCLKNCLMYISAGEQRVNNRGGVTRDTIGSLNAGSL